MQILRYLFFLIWPQRQLLWEFVLATKQSFDWFWFVSLSHRSFANNQRKLVKIITDILMMVTLFHFMYSDLMFHNLPPLSIVRKSTFVFVETNHKRIVITLNKHKKIKNFWLERLRYFHLFTCVESYSFIIFCLVFWRALG